MELYLFSNVYFVAFCQEKLHVIHAPPNVFSFIMNIIETVRSNENCNTVFFLRLQPKHGALQAPAKLRDAGMFKRLEVLGRCNSSINFVSVG